MHLRARCDMAAVQCNVIKFAVRHANARTSLHCVADKFNFPDLRYLHNDKYYDFRSRFDRPRCATRAISEFACNVQVDVVFRLNVAPLESRARKFDALCAESPSTVKLITEM